MQTMARGADSPSQGVQYEQMLVCVLYDFIADFAFRRLIVSFPMMSGLALSIGMASFMMAPIWDLAGLIPDAQRT